MLITYITVFQYGSLQHHKSHSLIGTRYIYMKLITLHKSSAIHNYTAPIMREKQSQINEG